MSRRDQKGATLVEFALIASLLFSLLLGMITLGIVEIGNSAGSNAAREGARVGFINFFCADHHSGCPAPSPGDNYDMIYQAVKNKAAGLVSNSLTVAVRCIDGTTVDPTYPSTSTKLCDTSIVPGTDLIEVSITWKQASSSPFTKGSVHSELARMIISGVPTNVPTPPSGGIGCVVTSATFAPNPATITSGGNLTAAETLTVLTNGDSSCAGLTAYYKTSSPTVTHTLTATLTDTAPTGTWTSGTQLVDIKSSGGDVLFANATFTIGGCYVSAIQFSPPTLGSSPPTSPATGAPVDGTFHLLYPETVTAVTNGDPACSTLYASYPLASPGFVESTPMQPSLTVTNGFYDTLQSGSGGHVWSVLAQSVSILASDKTTQLATAPWFVSPPGSAQLHISALSATSSVNGSNWKATVTVTVKDESTPIQALVSGVAVTGTWSPDAQSSGGSGCTTDVTGTCSFTTDNGSAQFKTSTATETWTVSSLSKTGYTYDSTADTLSSKSVTHA